MKTALAAYLLWAIQTWLPPTDDIRQNQIDVADEIGAAIDIEHGSVREALILASLAYHEGGFAPWVGDGRCNRAEWRRAHPKAAPCDGGDAYGWWQIHPERGIGFDGDGVALVPYAKGEVYHGDDLLRDPVLAARIALRIVRYSMNRSGSLRLYTGEGVEHPKADGRLGLAEGWAAHHVYYPWDAVAWR